MQNVLSLHKANSNAFLEEVSALTTASASSIDFLASGDETTSSLFDELHNALTSHQGEMVLFARELRQKFHTTMEQTHEMSEYISSFFQKLMEESKNAENRVAEANDNQLNSIIDFQKTHSWRSQTRLS